MKQLSYPHIAARAFNTPLMIHPGKLQAILNALGPRFGGAVRMDGVEPVDHVVNPVMSEAEHAEVVGSIAVIDVGGTLINRGAYADGYSGLTSYEWIRGEIQACLDDAKVRGILLRMDSYGGEVSGAWDAADAVREARAKKPVWCSVDDYAFSACYLLASQCERIYVTRTSGVGSVGVIAMHADFSRMENNEGITVTTVKAGQHKDDWSPHKPLDAEALAWMQASVDDSYSMFCDYVSWGRNISADVVRATEAQIYEGQGAIDIKFADKFGTFEQALAEMASALGPKSARSVGGTSAATVKGGPMATPETAEINTAETNAAPPVDAAAIERQRIAGVLALPEAAGREALARELALTPGMAPETAQRILAAAPVQAKNNGFAEAMASVPNPKVGADAGTDDGDEQKLIQSIIAAGGKQ